MAFARIDGRTLHFRLDGAAGAPVLALVNSIGSDARIWDDSIEKLAAQYRILSYDKRGHGLSDAPPGDYTIDDHVDDLAGLLTVLDIDTLALGGVSVGGLIAQAFTLRYPRRLRALMLCNTAPRIGDSAMWAGRIGAVRSGGLESIADSVMQRWFTPAYHRDRQAAVAGWRNMLVRTPEHGYLGTCATLRDTDLRGRIGTITTPTLVIAGEDDLATPVDLVRTCAQAIGGARLEILPGVGHIPFIEQPAAFAGRIDRFLKETLHG